MSRIRILVVVLVNYRYTIMVGMKGSFAAFGLKASIAGAANVPFSEVSGHGTCHLVLFCPLNNIVCDA